jgi:hypothetical protein
MLKNILSVRCYCNIDLTVGESQDTIDIVIICFDPLHTKLFTIETKKLIDNTDETLNEIAIRFGMDE